MNIVINYPPNIDQIRKRFDLTGIKPVFAWGDILFNPTGLDIPKHLMIHEEVHYKQQGKEIEDWWERYLIDDKFRLDQELEAYRKQYQFIKKTTDRNISFKYLNAFASDLSGKMYGNIINYEDAINKIKC